MQINRFLEIIICSRFKHLTLIKLINELATHWKLLKKKTSTKKKRIKTKNKKPEVIK